MGRVLIANRGEIAIRIARGARAAGIVPLGIYSEADARALHVAALDDAVCVGPPPATESYLSIERVLTAARELGADAIHPGYGFLSERAAFARAVRDAGITFVGPSPEAIAAMGDKIEAKRRARAHGVPVVPGYDGDDRSVARLRAEAEKIGAPLLIKASAGGGGRGMRVVSDLATFEEALEAAGREAAAAFGDSTVLLERYLVRPRHIEFQILADEHGKTIHLGERECSIQRRHQKLIEEAPSLAVDAALRERMGDAAVRVARSVDYTNAGTVEFMLDEAGEFYFLEMNARLQVEHPVTELVHGIDLVGWQFAIASGAELTLEQGAIRANGWAIEARINAEDPENDYLPATGSITRFEPPAGEGIRLDAGVASGSDVSIFYDSMLAKLIAHGPDRASAIGRLGRALDDFRIDGLRTNIPLQARILAEPAFRSGDTTTSFLSEHPGVARADPAAERAATLVALAAAISDPRAWRIAGGGIPVRLQTAGRTLALVASRASATAWRVSGDITADLTVERTGRRLVVNADGERYVGDAALDAGGVDVRIEGRTTRFAFAAPPSLE
ncbi:MAG: acetyl-CoA carboxylase biotin carboxylase subunit, partial [Candidatus Eremiobacteraeota bacterium]|nr:acetyl-CoA carboxylase biotin carboxylase subunit [Candidatus Eremiobacteraeota bacterium]